MMPTTRSEMYLERKAPPMTAMRVAKKWPVIAPAATPARGGAGGPA